MYRHASLIGGILARSCWTYLPGSDLKESLAYPNGDVVRWEYEPRRDLVTLVSNGVHSSFRYAYDAAGRRVSKDDERYRYNPRGELILATNVVTGAEFAYRYDDIGSRPWSRELGTNCTYAANEHNQYTNVVRGGVFELSAFDLDGNQTNLVTSTGEWSVEYNGENRPVRWTRNSDGTVVTMSYDIRGRRVTKNAERFVYDGYLNIGQTVWDPTEPVSTRPLCWIDVEGCSFLFHDARKNVSGILSNRMLTCHYSPFGGHLEDNGVRCPWRFSSEYTDEMLGLMYYNYRVLDSLSGRWMSRDPIEDVKEQLEAINEIESMAIPVVMYVYVSNDPISAYDRLGLDSPGCDGVGVIPGWENDCRLKCCAKHDKCYYDNNCKATSWFSLLNPFRCSNDCDKCNKDAVDCTLACFGGGDPNQPDDEKYFCACTGSYVKDKNDCPKSRCVKWQWFSGPRGDSFLVCVRYTCP